jgi:hypothetical protein
VTLLSADVQCGQPSLRPGDVVKTPKGNVGVITAAQTVVNGRPWNWDEFPLTEKQLQTTGYDHIAHGWLPNYSVQFRSGTGEKYAWWYSLEFTELVSLGPFHEDRERA